MVFRQAVPPGDSGHRLREEVPAHEYIPVPLRQFPDKAPNTLLQLPDLVLRLHVRSAGQTVRQFIQNKIDLPAAALFRTAGVEAVDGQVAGDPRQEHP